MFRNGNGNSTYYICIKMKKEIIWGELYEICKLIDTKFELYKDYIYNKYALPVDESNLVYIILNHEFLEEDKTEESLGKYSLYAGSGDQSRLL